jgi:hypothetical protein
VQVGSLIALTSFHVPEKIKMKQSLKVLSFQPSDMTVEQQSNDS